PDFVQKAALARRLHHMGTEAGHSVQGWLRLAHKKPQYILNPPLRHEQVHRSDLAVHTGLRFAVHARGNFGPEKAGTDAIESHVPVQPIDESVEGTAHMNRMLAARYAEVGNVNITFRLDASERTGKLVGRIEYAGYAMKDTEVGFVEGVVARHRSRPGI